MISEYVREQKRYTQKDLCDLLHASEDSVVPVIRKLKEFGVLKAVRASETQRDLTDLADIDIEIADVEAGENEYYYVFTFVGVIVVAGRVLKCYPKYLLHADNPKEQLRQVLKVLEKYSSKEQIVRMYNESSENRTFNLLAVLLFLLHDYYNNGVYSNTEDIVESNGSGEILWDKTINDSFTLISGNRPYYIDLQTRKRVTDEYDYFQRLHECILTKASKELADAQLIDIFEITEVDLTDETLDDFGEEEYILYRIEKELNTQFNTRKQLVLKTIYAYLNHKGALNDIDCLSMFGTNSFNLVWEGVCADILDNKLNKQIDSLPITVSPRYDRRTRLIDLIEKPLWTITGKTATDTLIPDIVSVSKTDNEVAFVLFDAKYYLAELDPDITPKGQPGIESITKQYLYQLAFLEFIRDHEIDCVKNCFLMPTEQDAINNKGEVILEMLASMGLQNIQVRLIPAEKAYDLYLSGEKLDVKELRL